MERMLFSKVLHMSLIGCYSILIVLAVRFFLKKAGRKYCYYLWMIVFLNLCIPFSVFSSFSLIPKQISGLSIDTMESGRTSTEQFSETEDLADADFTVFSPNGTVNYRKDFQEVLPSITEPEIIQNQEASEVFTFQWQQILPWAEKIWLFGIALFVLHSIYSVVCLKHRIQEMETSDRGRKKKIVELKGLEAPFIGGIVRPTIYLPTDMDVEERQYILAHETCHLKRKDHLLKILTYAVTVLHWFNPLVWFAYSLYCKDMEISCDETVLEKSTNNIRKDYAQSLLKYAAKQNRYLMTPLTFGEPSVRSRIENVLKYRKKGVLVSVTAILITAFVAVGLFIRPEETTAPVAETEEMPEAAKSLRLPIVNNGGELIQVGDDFYYVEGKKLYSDGKSIYTTNTDDEGIAYIYQFELDGSGYRQMMEGTLVGVNDNHDEFYYLTESEDDRTSFNIYSPNSVDVHQVYDRNAVFLAIADDWIYSYRKEADGLYLERTRISEEGYEDNLLGRALQAEEISCLYAEDYLIFAAGTYEGSAGYYYGNLYSYDMVEKQLKQEHLTDDDKFLVFDGYIYYQKYFNQGEEGNDLYRVNFDLSEEENIGENIKLLTVDKENGTLLAEKDGELLRIWPDSKEVKCLFKLADSGMTWQENDTITFTEINFMKNDIYMKAERWGYQEGNGWRDSLIESRHFQIKADGSAFQVWNPNAILEESDDSFNFLTDSMPGIPCEDPTEAGWDLKNVEDIRENFSYRPYIPEPGTEKYTYLIGKTENYALYGKGDYESMLLECNGEYAEINYPYASNYMIPLELLEADLDRDGFHELAIKFNIKHGTGVSIDTFFLADINEAGKLYVYQFLEEDYIAQLEEHLSYHKTEDGIYAAVDGKQAGAFMANAEGMDPWISVGIGSQIAFYYTQEKIEISAELLFMDDEIGAVPWVNKNDITATVTWNRDGTFRLTDFRSRNRYLDYEIQEALKKVYGTTNISIIDIAYDSSQMDQEILPVTAVILTEGSDSYDYAEIDVKRDEEEYSYSGWKVGEILLQK